MMALNRYRLEDEARKNSRRAKLLRKMLKQPDRLLGTILLGNNLVNNLAVAITTVLALRLFGDFGVAISTILITIAILIFAEVPPKTFAATRPDGIARLAGYPLYGLQRILYPVVWMVSYTAKLLELIPGFRSGDTVDSLKEDELRIAILASEKHIAKYQHSALLSVLEIGNATVEAAMVPLSKIEAINLDDSEPDITRQILATKRTRLPVYRGTINNIQGELLTIKLLQGRKPKKDSFSKQQIEKSLIDPLYMPEDAKLMSQIRRLQELDRTMGIVIDEYGDVRGIATLRVMLEEIAGTVDRQSPSGIVKRTENCYDILANTSIRDLNRVAGWQLPTDGPNTLNGLVLEHLGHIPNPSTALKVNGYVIETLEVRGTAVSKVRVTALPESVRSDDID